MNKQSAIEQANILQQQMKEMQEQMNQLQEQAVRLQQIINAPEKKQSLLQAPEAGGNSDYFTLDVDACGCLTYDECAAYSSDSRFYKHGNLFQSEKLAQDYARAINTMLLLRHQEGAVTIEHSCQQWVVALDDLFNVCSDYFAPAVNKIARISPCFESKEAAQKAIESVGEENIVHMFKTFHHVED